MKKRDDEIKFSVFDKHVASLILASEPFEESLKPSEDNEGHQGPNKNDEI